MVTLFYGIPASGKTRSAIEHIIAQLKTRRHVHAFLDDIDMPALDVLQTNSELTAKEFELYFHRHQQKLISDFVQFVTPGSFVVLDDIVSSFNKRCVISPDIIDFLREQKTSSTDLLLISQSIVPLHNQIISSVDIFFRFRNGKIDSMAGSNFTF